MRNKLTRLGRVSCFFVFSVSIFLCVPTSEKLICIYEGLAMKSDLFALISLLVFHIAFCAITIKLNRYLYFRLRST